ncbi:hypothetical protein HBH53_180750 [Parastagonospora nodorum]|nr:hypothetical protein HBH53_180750 [Parastagonospora nodorum]KAH4159754.1 hypothetical protein HBH43_183760 [Parastagonospora nodorum]KAH4187790.1 hypothetical protein HBH42_150100 [Parastagonospora nodorum]KAH5187067.1 hypothetical protein HBH76_114260 [Parastagonospora nodorum]KAH6012032.1 hypothetical protein HBI82_123180 [Parastagonospora nodorum]
MILLGCSSSQYQSPRYSFPCSLLQPPVNSGIRYTHRTNMQKYATTIAPMKHRKPFLWNNAIDSSESWLRRR